MDVFDLFAKISIDTGEYEKGLKSAGEIAESASGKFSKFGGAMKSGLVGIGKVAVSIGKVSVKALAATTTAIGVLMKTSIEGYAEYEQLVGGVETLFGAGGKSIEEYANSVGKTVSEVQSEYDALMRSQETVLANAGEAYKNAGLSANEYMETVTSFSASLLQSLGGDTQAAADYADMAITDMSDNANKMGTSMEMIQNAYSGFAKSNFTMLDNLNIFGGMAA